MTTTPSKPVVKKPAAPRQVASRPAAPTHMAKRAPSFRMQTAEQRRTTRFLKLLVYGNFGVGKTYLAATSAEVEQMNDVLLISAESGDQTLDDDNKAFDNIITIPIQNFKQFADIHEFLVQHCKARDAKDIDKLRELQARFMYGEDEVDPASIEKPWQFRTVLIDSLTEVEAQCMNQILGISDGTRIDAETQAAEWTHFRANHSQILRLIRQFRDLPVHIVFTASEQYNQDEMKKFKYSPDMTGKLSKKIQGFMDMVGYYERTVEGEREVRKLHVVPSARGKFDAKHRYSRFKETAFINPTIGSILQQTGLDRGTAELS